MRFIKVSDHPRPDRKRFVGSRHVPAGSATVLVDEETGSLYYCERLREGSIEDIQRWIEDPPWDEPVEEQQDS